MFSGIAEIYDTLVVQIHLYFDIIKCFLSKKALIQDMGNPMGREEAGTVKELAFGYGGCIATRRPHDIPNGTGNQNYLRNRSDSEINP